MAERRMFSKKIIGSAKFLKMPTSSRELYFQLGLYADDEGIVEAFSVMKLTGSTEDDLRVLIAKDFIRILNEDLVAIITDWKENNLIRPDRFHPSNYHDLLIQMTTNCQPDDNQLPTNCQPNDDKRFPEVRLGKEREGKDSKVVRHKHGQYNNVLLSDEELEKAKEEIPDYDKYIERISEYCASTGKSYKNYLATLRNWYRRDQDKKPKEETFNSSERYKQPWLED